MLGTLFDTGNLHVSVLAESTIKIIEGRLPPARSESGRELSRAAINPVLIISHLFPELSMPLESDTLACRQVPEDLKGRFGGRGFLASGCYSQNEFKHLIGLCGFFLGSHMTPALRRFRSRYRP